MFKSKKKKRIEPRIASKQGLDHLDIEMRQEDRIVQNGPSKRQKIRKNDRAPKIARTTSRVAKNKRSHGSRARPARGFFAGLFYWTTVFAIWGSIGIASIMLYYGVQLPSAATWNIPDRPPNVTILDRNGELIANRGATGGAAIGLQEMSPYLPNAVIAIEDRRFKSHFGLDPIGLARAMTRNIIAGRFVEGGSTLTQQLAKNLFLSPERTIGRKVQEVLLALWLENKYSKEQILELYLNRVYFGSGAYGADAAARRYFKKPARDLTLPEAALLAGLLKAPSRLSPNRNPQLAQERAELVLAAMRQQGMVSQSDLDAAKLVKSKAQRGFLTGSEHYVADYVMEQLQETIGEVKTDISVTTTIDLASQNQAERVIRQSLAEAADHKVTQGAMVSIDTSGGIRALVGGRDYGDSQFDRATEARRQPGSAFKPFVYLAALRTGMTPQSMRNDAPITIGKWRPENYKGRYQGPVTLQTALAQSLNSVAAQLIMEVGAKNVANLAHDMGIDSPLNANASLSLGTSEVTLLELTSAYLPFATGGVRPKLHIIRDVKTKGGKQIYEFKPEPKRVLSADEAGMMNAMMSQTTKSGTARNAQFNHPVAGKTGTTQNARDALFIGYSAHNVTGFWYGNDNGDAMHNVTGGSLPASSWKQYMEPLHAQLPLFDLPGYTAITVVPKPRPADLMVLHRNDGATQAPDRLMTSSTNLDRPTVGLGETKRKTVLDIILGR